MGGLLSQRRTVAVIAAVACLAVMVAGWFLLISPQRAKVAALRTDVTTQESKNSSLQAQVTMLQALAAQLPQQQAALNKTAAKVPSKPGIPDLLRTLNQAAETSGVELTSITPSPVAAIPGADGVQGIDVALSVSGGYLSLEQFELALENLPRAFLVQGISVAGGAGSSSTGASGATTGTSTGAASSPSGAASGALTETATISGRVLVSSASGPTAATPG